MITTEMKAKVQTRIDECMQIIKAKYKVDMPQPTIQFDLKGTSAGTADYRKWVIQINPVFLKNNFEDMLYETVPHELAHLATHVIYPEAHKRTWNTKRRPHGAEWQSIMRSMGVEPQRTHNYDLTDVIKPKAGSVFIQCSACKRKFVLGAKRAERFKEVPHAFKCKCRQAGSQFELVDHEHTKTVDPKPTVHMSVSTPTTPTTPVTKHVVVKPSTTGSKLDRCIELYTANKELSRSELIKMFVSIAQCTPAGASTYYNTCKSRVG